MIIRNERFIALSVKRPLFQPRDQLPSKTFVGQRKTESYYFLLTVKLYRQINCLSPYRGELKARRFADFLRSRCNVLGRDIRGFLAGYRPRGSCGQCGRARIPWNGTRGVPAAAESRLAARGGRVGGLWTALGGLRRATGLGGH